MGLRVLAALIVAVALAGCGDWRDPTTGAITAEVRWPGEGASVAGASVPFSASLPMVAPAGVTQIRGLVLLGGTVVAQATYAATPGVGGSGSVGNVPAGGGYTLRVEGLDGGGAVLYQTETTGITVTAGATTNAGTVTMQPSIVGIAAGTNFTLALGADGTVWAFGNNMEGQLGRSPSAPASITTPVRVCAPGATAGGCTLSGGTVLTNVQAIAAGDNFSLALLNDGTVWAWGTNVTGQLGRGGAIGTEYNPVAVCERESIGIGPACTAFLGSTMAITAIAAGGNNSLALRSNQQVLSWGSGPAESMGQGDTPTGDRPDLVCNVNAPTAACQAIPLTNVTAIAMGTGHGLAVLGGSTVASWGSNGQGQMGRGDVAISNIPRPVCAVGASPTCSVGVNNLTGMTGVAAGWAHSMAWNAAGDSPRWGNNNRGMSGESFTADDDCTAIPCLISPHQPAGTSGMSPLAGGALHTVGYHAASGTLRSWGDNQFAQLGIGSVDSGDHIAAETVIGVANVVALAAGFHHSVALDAGGTVWTWGQSESGQLARGGNETCGAMPNSCDSTPQPVTFE